MIILPLIKTPGTLKLKGKIIIQYHSQDQNFLAPATYEIWTEEVEFVEFEGDTKNGKKTFFIKFKDFFKKDIWLCLSTKEIFSEYLKIRDGWNVIKNEILWDNKNLFLVGEFEPPIPINENDQLEKYKYFVTIEFGDKKDPIMKFLNKEL